MPCPAPPRSAPPLRCAARSCPPELDQVRLHSDAVRVEDHIQLHHMVQLKDKWQEHGLSLDKKQFRDVIWDVFGSALGDMFEVHTSFLFKKMDTNQDQEVDWDEFCTMTSTSFRPFRALFAEPHAAPNAPCNMICCVRTLVGC